MLKNYDKDQIRSLAYTGSLIKGTAHNINTPLSSVLGRADILRLRFEQLINRISDPDLLKEFEKCSRDIGLLIDNSNRVSSLVKNLVHRCATSTQNNAQPVNIAYLLQEDFAFLLSDMEFKHNTEKKLNFDTSIPTIMGSPVHFSNSFIEIILNAQAAMLDNKNKIIAVSVVADERNVVIAVNDNGHGIDEKTRLAMLHTLENPPTADTGSLSGLACVAFMLQSYKPRFQVESSPGDTTVTVALPVEDSAHT